jgi:hypothetical protein
MPEPGELPSIEIDAPGVITVVLGQQCKSTLSVEQERRIAKDMEAAWRSVRLSLPAR